MKRMINNLERLFELSKVSRLFVAPRQEILLRDNWVKNHDNNTRLGKGPADQIVKFLLESDEITIIIGTKINIAHQDLNLPVELEIRRTVIKRIACLLEEKFLKEVNLTYL